MDNEKEKKNNKTVSSVLMFVGALIVILCAYAYYKDNSGLLLDALFAFLGIAIILLGYLFQNLSSLFDGDERIEEEEKEE